MDSNTRDMAQIREDRAADLESVELLKPDAVAELLGVDVATLAAWRSSRPRDLVFVKLGGRCVRYRRSDVEAFVARHVVHTSALERTAA